MTSSRTMAIFAALALAAALAGCNEKRDPGFQGWVEADMIFVSPDESGRVTKLNIREGDEIATLRVSIKGQEPHDVPLVAGADVTRANALQRLRNGLVGLFE